MSAGAVETGSSLMTARICLVVDDSKVVRKVARRILEANGFDVEEAEDGQKALDACRRALPQAVLLDWNMPVMNGIEFLTAFRSEFLDGPPVVFCTTESELEKITQAIETGASEYIMKPFDEAILMDKFRQVGLL
jgi:two-component system chemotaxis response regulator CheY